MLNCYQPRRATIVSITKESAETKLFRLRFADRRLRKEFEFWPGQFLEIGLPGWGECPINICSSSAKAGEFLELAIRRTGSLTGRLHQLAKGDSVYLRGPFGKGFPLERFKDKPLILIGGGCGFIPIRGLINEYLEDGILSSIVQVFYGCRDEETMLFKREYSRWQRHLELTIILEKPSSSWRGRTGLVTDLLAEAEISGDSLAVVVGPPIMFQPVLKELKKKKIDDKNIYFSLERRMHCGVGVCQHCAIGPYYVCQDGPVFSWDQLKDIPGAI